MFLLQKITLMESGMNSMILGSMKVRIINRSFCSLEGYSILYSINPLCSMLTVQYSLEIPSHTNLHLTVTRIIMGACICQCPGWEM